jgi:uncharacterized protein YjbI with pentapeptide repeats
MPVPIAWEPVGFTIGFALLAAALLGAGLWWAWWELPKREVARLALKIRDPKARADVEDNIRKTVGQGLGGVAVLLGAGLAYLQFSQQQRASHDLLISNQVSKGFEQLGSKKVVIRLGGIYALEGVMNNSDQYHRPVLEALTASIRDGTRATTPASPLPTDIQAALTVIGRRSASRSGVDRIDLSGVDRIDLRGASLVSADLVDANLADANLAGANLTNAHLSGAYLTWANLFNANLTGADLVGADLTRASLSGAHLDSASLGFAHLDSANLGGAHLDSADLTSANLSGAYLRDADLTGANLVGADLIRANLIHANLSRANLRGARINQKQLDEACGSDATLPTGLTLKPCPSQSSP